MKTFTKLLAGAVTILALAMIGCQNDTDTHTSTLIQQNGLKMLQVTGMQQPVNIPQK